MNEAIENVLIFLFGAGSVGAIAIWVFNNRTALISVVAWFYRTFSWISKRMEYGNVASNIEATVNKVGDQIDSAAPDVLPYPIRISWVKTPDSLDTSLRNGELVVTMQYSANRDRNLIVSTLAYLRKGLLPRARAYVDRTLMKATDFAVAKDVLGNSGLEMAVPMFFDEYLDPALSDDPQLLEEMTRVDRIDNAGFFQRVYLRELKQLGDKVYPATPNVRIWDESKSFAEFLETVAEKERGVDVPGGLMFPGSRIRTSLMLVARARTREIGTRVYLRRIEIDQDRGVEHMYVFARSDENIALAAQVIEEAKSGQMLHVVGDFEYSQEVSGSLQPAVCYVCALNLRMRPRAEVAPSETLLEVLRENIPELDEGKIEAVAAARYPSQLSKIAVRSVDKDIDALTCCKADDRLEAIETSLGEDVHFVAWTDNPGELVIASLYPLEPDMVVDIEIDEDNQRATINVDGWKPKRRALGRGNANVRLASEITGWQLEVVDISDESAVVALDDNPRTE